MSEQPTPPTTVPTPTTTSGRNRRSFARRRPRGRLKVICYKGSLDLGENHALSLADVSESGVRLFVKHELDKNQEVTLMLEGREHNRAIKASGRVVWCRPQPDGQFQIGVQLTNYLQYRDILKMT